MDKRDRHIGFQGRERILFPKDHHKGEGSFLEEILSMILEWRKGETIKVTLGGFHPQLLWKYHMP